MSDLTPLFALLAVLAATLGTVSVWSPRRMTVKAGALAVAFALMGTGYAAMLDLLSKPKPASFEWWLDKAGEATVLGNSMVEDQAIYLWLQLDGVAGAARLRAALGPAHRRAAAGGGPGRGRAAVGPADAAAVREVAG